MLRRIVFMALTAALLPALPVRPAEPKADAGRGEAMLADYFAAETAKLGRACLADVHSADDWKARRGRLRQELLEMLGLDPLPERTDLKAAVTGRTERDGIVVENVHFQSRPQLYVTGNLYLPAKIDKPLPAILYVCGHAQVKIDGICYGSKAAYQHHGAWFARHGYACLTIDTLQLGEIEGIHHGTYREKMWWWANRGYTPAGVEAWNCTRALDYLQSRKEIDPERIGVTGRSGGGAYSWWIAAIDDRIKAAVPVAGITDLRNHVVDGAVDGHCDCMFMVNTYRWDYPQVAALVAPRAMMIGNSDRDRIFPLDGVVRTYNQARRIYEMFDAGNDLALSIGPGPHQDTQDLQVPAFRWFNRHLKGDTATLIDEAAEKRFKPQELRVFRQLPGDQINAKIHETFVAAAPPPEVPDSPARWQDLRDGWRTALREKSFRGWPEDVDALAVKEVASAEAGGLRIQALEFTSQGPVRLPLYAVRRAGDEKPQRVRLQVLDQQDWAALAPALRPVLAVHSPGESLPSDDPKARAALAASLPAGPCAVVYFPPRGVGPTAWGQTEKQQTGIRRRFLLLGQTLEGMQVWDVRRAVKALRSLDLGRGTPLTLSARGPTAGIALYASLFEPDIAELVLHELPPNHRNGPTFLNVSRYLEMPQAVALAAERSRVRLLETKADNWKYVRDVADKLHWGEQQFRVE
jgi:dienelactone hydrolase